MDGPDVQAQIPGYGHCRFVLVVHTGSAPLVHMTTKECSYQSCSFTLVLCGLNDPQRKICCVFCWRFCG